MLTTVSKSGKRARAPQWWGVLLSFVPQIIIPSLEPKEWTEELAKAWVDRIPPKCPFERQLWFRDRLVLYIPPLCPLNPVSKQLYQIRIKAQTYLLYLNSAQ